MTNRKQFVEMTECLLNDMVLKSGVPQGFVFGSVLLHCISNTSTDSVIQFSDDKNFICL